MTEPVRRTDDSKSSGNRMTPGRIVGAVIAGCVMVAIGYGIHNLTSEEYIEGNDGLLYSTDLAEPPGGQLDQAAISVDRDREAEVLNGEEILQPLREHYLDELRGKGYVLDPGKPADDNTDREIADQFMLDIYAVSQLESSDWREAKEALKAVINPDSPAADDYERYWLTISNNPEVLPAIKDVPDWTKTFKNNSYLDVPSNGLAMRVLTIQFVDDTYNQLTFRRDSESGPWSVQKMVPVNDDDPDYTPDLREIDKVVS
ncbi:hypothetical protein [Mycolicibacterium sp. PDY-3]|uniref:hypothetical protein n=1 Tax=Mycolicibacterium sp. PDY-3 TaxID=3376069 RepID=UPI0037A7D7EC